MWTMSMYVLFSLFGVAGVGMALWHLRSLPERGRPDSRKLYIDHYFHGCGFLLVSSVFVGIGVAALFFGYDLGVPSQRGFVESMLNSLALAVVLLTWRWIRKRRRS